MTTTVDEPAGQQHLSPLMAAIFTRMFAESAATTNALIDSLQHRADEAEAELYAIRTGVERLLAGDYMPNPDAIRRAVFCPDKELINEYKANKEVGW